MMTLRAAACFVALSLMFGLYGCSKSQEQSAGAAADVSAEYAPAAPRAAASAAMDSETPAKFLAYEHDIGLTLPEQDIAARIEAVSQACLKARFGECALLDVSQRNGAYVSGQVKLRIVPSGVGPIIALAGEGGAVASRSTRAEDLAQQVSDNQLTQDRLRKEHDRLLEFQQRRDLKVADMLAISQRLAEIEAGLDQAQREAAQQQRRITTQLVTLDFQATSSARSRSAIGEALSDFGSILSDSIATLVRVIAALLPFVVVLGCFGWLARKLWRRRKTAKG